MRPADDMDVVVQSVGPPQRLEATPSSAVYEQTVLLQVVNPGRYAVRIEGGADQHAAAHEPTVPAAQKTFELHAAAVRRDAEGAGRDPAARFRDGSRHAGNARRSRAGASPVGAADSRGLPQLYAPAGRRRVALLAKPDVLAYDQVDGRQGAAQGTGVATGFAAGVAAARARAVGARGLAQGMRIEPGGVVNGPNGEIAGPTPACGPARDALLPQRRNRPRASPGIPTLRVGTRAYFVAP